MILRPPLNSNVQSYSGRPVKDADVRVLTSTSSIQTHTLSATNIIGKDLNSIHTNAEGGTYRELSVDNLIVNDSLIINAGDIFAPYLVKTNNLSNTFESVARWSHDNILVDSNVFIDNSGNVVANNITANTFTINNLVVVDATVSNNLFANHIVGNTASITTVNSTDFNGTNATLTGTVTALDFSGTDAVLSGTVDANAIHAVTGLFTDQVEAKTFKVDGQVTIAVPNPLPASPYTIELPSTFPPTLNQFLAVKAINLDIINVDWTTLPTAFANNLVNVVAGQPVIPSFQYPTVAQAITFVNTQVPSPTNLWVILIYPGIYNETNLVLPSYTSLQGVDLGSCVIQGSADNHHVLTLEDYTYLENITVNGPTSTGYAGIFNNISNFAAIVINTTIQNCDIGVYGINNNGANNVFLYLTICTFSNNVTNSVLLDSTAGAGSVNYYSFVSSTYITNVITMLGPAIDCVGINTTYYSMSDEAERDPNGTPALPPTANTPPPVGTYMSVRQGATAFVNSLTVLFFEVVFDAPIDGSTPTLNVGGANFFNCYLNFNLLNPNIEGYFSGQSPFKRTVYPIDAQWFVNQVNPRILTVGLNAGSDFQSISSALSSISSPGPSNRFLIQVGVGQYTISATLVMQPYVDLVGVSLSQTILILVDGVQGITISPNSSVSNLTVTGTGNVSVPPAFLYAGDVSLSSTYLSNLLFQNVYNSIQFSNTNAAHNILAEVINCTWYQNFAWGTNIDITVAGFCGISLQTPNLYGMGNTFNYFLRTTSVSPLLPCYLNVTDGILRPDLTAMSFNGTGFYLPTCFCDIRNMDMSYLTNGIVIPNSANSPILRTMGLLMHDITNSVIISNPNTVGNINGMMSMATVTINADNVSTSFVDPSGTGSTLSGNIFQGDNFTQTTNITTQITQGSTLGLAIGGTLSLVGTNITVLAGSGYIMQGTYPNDYLYYLEFGTQTLAAADNTLSYIYINSAGTMILNVTEPNTTTNIMLGVVMTAVGVVLYIQRTKHEINHLASSIDTMLTSALGPIYATGGSQVTSSASPVPPNNVTRIAITGGQYYFGNLSFSPDPKLSTQSFLAFYRDPAGLLGNVGNTYTYQTLIDVPIQWDDGTGVLQAITVGDYVVHVLYVVGSDTDTQYLLVYGTEQFVSLAAAQTGPLALSPSFFQENVASIATLIVTNNGVTNDIVSIQNIQPTVAYRSGTLSSTSNHSALSNLTADDHKQYLLVNGTRAMAGELNMGTNSVINITYESVLPTVVGSIVAPVSGLNLAVPTGTTPYNYYFPTTGGTFGYVLSTDGSGVTSWSSVASLPITGDIDMSGHNIINGGTFSANFIHPAAGAVGAPSLYFSTDTTTGLYRPALNQIGISVSGANALTVSSTGLAMNSLVISGVSTLTSTTINNGAGTVGLPSYYMSTDTTTGLYRPGANQIGISVSGANVLTVSSTGLAMNNLAISGVSTLSVATLTVTTALNIPAGAVGAPSLYMSTDTTTGMYRPAANQIGFTVSTVSTVIVLAAGLNVVKAGAAATPSLYFSTDTTTGLYRSALNQVAVAVSGLNVVTISSTGLASTAINNGAGAVGSPSYYMSTDTTTGMYRPSANQIGFAVSGSNVFTVLSTGITVNNLNITGVNTLGVSTLTVTTSLNIPAGAVGAPSLYMATDTTTGMYRPAANQIGFTVSGVNTLNVKSSGINVITAGTAGAPSLYFSTDTTTGLFRTAANQIGLAISGTNTVNILSTGLNVITAGTAGAPSLYFSTDTTSGLYRFGANQIGITAAGTNVITVAATPILQTNTISNTNYNGLSVTGTSTDITAATHTGVLVNVAYKPATGPNSNNYSGITVSPTFAVSNASTLSGVLTSLNVSNLFTGNAGTLSVVRGIYYDGGGTLVGTITTSYGAYITVPAAGTTKCATYTDNLSVGYTAQAPPASGLTVSGLTTLGTNTQPTPSTQLTVFQSGTTNAANIVLSGNSIDGAGSSTEGVVLGLNHNTSGNRQLAIGDSSFMAVNATNAIVRISAQPAGGTSWVDCVSTNATALPMQFGNSGSTTTVTGSYTKFTSAGTAAIGVCTHFNSTPTYLTGGNQVGTLWSYTMSPAIAATNLICMNDGPTYVIPTSTTTSAAIALNINNTVNITATSSIISNLYGIAVQSFGLSAAAGAGSSITNVYGGYFTLPSIGTNKHALHADNLSVGYIGANFPASNSIICSGQVNVADGTAGAPAHSFFSETTSGMYRVTTNQVGFSVNSANRMTISASGICNTATTPTIDGNADQGLQIISTTTSKTAQITCGNSNLSNFITLWSGRVGDANPSLIYSVPFRLASATSPNTAGFTQTFGITSTEVQTYLTTVIGAAGALATNATSGMLQIPSCAGAATGTVSNISGKVSMVYDSTNFRLYISVGSGVWKSVLLS